MRTLIIRLFSPVGTEVSRLQGLVQQPGGEAVRFLGAAEPRAPTDLKAT